jgi:hypothetical protein
MIFERHRLATRFLALAFALAFSMFMPTAEAEAACTVPNSISNGQTADATAVMGNFNALKDCANSAVSPSGTPAAGNLSVFSSSTTITNGNLSGDCTTAGTVAVTCTKTNGTSFGSFATGTDAGQLTGTVSVNRFNNGANADSTHFLRGDGVWAMPSGGGGGSGQPWYLANKPAAADFTIVSGDATNPTLTDDADEGLQFNLGTIVASDKWRSAEKVITTPTADWTVTAKVEALTPAINWRGAGLYIRDSVGGRIIGIDRYNGNSLEVARWGSLAGAWNSRILDLPNVGNHTGWFRIAYTASDNTYRFYYSLTGKQWVLAATELQTAYLANKANRIGFGGWYNGTTGPNTIGAVQYWLQTW